MAGHVTALWTRPTPSCTGPCVNPVRQLLESHQLRPTWARPLEQRNLARGRGVAVLGADNIFTDIPDEIDIVLANRPDLPPMRVGEPASETVWPAIANAIYDAVGVRLRRLPFTPSRILAAFHAG